MRLLFLYEQQRLSRLEGNSFFQIVDGLCLFAVDSAINGLLVNETL